MALTTRVLSPILGVEVVGLDLREPLDESIAHELRGLLDAHQLVLFRNQDLEVADQVRALECFGPVVDELGDGRYHSAFSNEPDSFVPGWRLMFHSDYVFTPQPVPVLSLYAVDVDDGSIPTQFASCLRAARLLSDEDRDRLAPLRAVHASDGSANATANLEATGTRRVNLLELPDDAPVAHYPRWTHPLLMPHPRTGEPMLFVSAYFTSHIEGFDVATSEALLADLLDRLYEPDNIYRHTWARGDLAVWDNLALQHARDNTYTGSPRTLRRVLVSERPVHELLAAASAGGQSLYDPRRPLPE